MNTPTEAAGPSGWQRIDELCDRFEQAKRSGENPQLAAYLAEVSSHEERELLLRELITLDLDLSAESNATVELQHYLDQLPGDESVVRTSFERYHARGRRGTAAKTAEPQLQPGQEFGAYTIVDRLGAGGMGHVYHARHKAMDRDVALKVLSPKLMDSPDAVARFRREIKAAARLQHPNIVTAFDAGEQDGLHFLVMEYVDGKDLSSYVKAKGPLSLKQALRCMLQAAKGLAYAHEQNIVHRDIKPANLLVDRKGTVKVLDMGLARFGMESDDQGSTELTRSGVVMGTVDYMAPEQSLDTRTADARSDIYSLGCTFWYLLTGRPVYDGHTVVQKLMAHRKDPIPSLRTLLPAIPDAVDQVFRKMVAKDRADRFPSVKEVIDALQGCLKGKSSTSSPSDLSMAADPQLADFLDQLSHDSSESLDAELRESKSFSSPLLKTVAGTNTNPEQPAGRVRQGMWKSRQRIIAVSSAVALILMFAVLKFSPFSGSSQGTTGDNKPPVTQQDGIVAANHSESDGPTVLDDPDFPGVLKGEYSLCNWTSLEPGRMIGDENTTYTRLDDNVILAQDDSGLRFTHQIELPAPGSQPIYAVRLEVFVNDLFPKQSYTPHWSGVFQLEEFDLFLQGTAEDDVQEIQPDFAWCDYQYYDHLVIGIQGTIDNKNPLIWHTYPIPFEPHEAIFVFRKPITVAPSDKLIVRLHHWRAGQPIGCFRLSVLHEPYPGERQQLLYAIKRDALRGDLAQSAAGVILGHPEWALSMITKPNASQISDQALIVKATIHSELGQNDELADCLAQLERSTELSTEGHENLYQIYLKLQTVAHNNSLKLAQNRIWEIELAQIAGALQGTNSATPVFSAEVNRRLAETRFGFEDYANALEAQKQAAALDPRNIRMRWRAGIYASFAQNPAEFNQILEQTIRDFPQPVPGEELNAIIMMGLLTPTTSLNDSLPIAEFESNYSFESANGRAMNDNDLVAAFIAYRRGDYQNTLAMASLNKNGLSKEKAIQAYVLRSLALYQTGSRREALDLLESLCNLHDIILLQHFSDTGDSGPQLVGKPDHLFDDELYNALLLREACKLTGYKPWEDSISRIDWTVKSCPIEYTFDADPNTNEEPTVASPTADDLNQACNRADWKEAARIVRKLPVNQDDPYHRCVWACVLLMADAHQEYHAIQQELFKLCGSRPDLDERERIVKVCSLLSSKNLDASEVLAFAEQAYDEASNKMRDLWYFRFTLALAELRVQRFSQAKERLEGTFSEESATWSVMTASGALALGLAELGDGNVEAAQRLFDLTESKYQDLNATTYGANFDWLISQVLFQELKSSLASAQRKGAIPSR